MEARNNSYHGDIPPLNTMYITEEECSWARALKAAAAQDEELKPLSDYEYAQHAIISKGNLEESLEKIRGLQYFREEYRIHDNPEEGIQLFRAFMGKHPGFVLSVECDDDHGHFVVVYDYARRRADVIDFPEDWRIHLGGLYYLSQTVTSHLMAVREGIVHICECEGMGWPNANRDHHRRGWDHFWSHYPLKHKEISWLRTPLAGNLLISFLKPLMSPNMRSMFQLGCTFHGYEGRIDGIFKMPTPEAAEENLLSRIHTYLSDRYHNQLTFRIPEPDIFDDDMFDEHDEDEDDDMDDDDDDDDDDDEAWESS